ncbi:NAD(P)-dependent oxidoreductase [Nostocoides sp. Soil756]|jgi:phosphoglycerate dehydrogenase-like enzyme|uniref:NAD(P)-dependent oxidoreductase n=1 Tax=Nostocoides sp. Soil756 TaxID=1736399 RepID=UPI00070029A1|nr:NAD(P)-dependent oxidoreductase [Tetrasphaera sp. Soil756]KRE63783.1 hypothetical protein ASG78_01990 [Tetrasphaera sp. Soil756]
MGADPSGGRPFRVALSGDLASATQQSSWGDIGLDALAAEGIGHSFLPDEPVLRPEDLDGLDAVLFAAPRVDAASVSGPRPPCLLARFGVGLDAVDVEACTAAGVGVTITPDGARRPVATAALTLVLAVQHRLLVKHRLVERGRWDDKLAYMGRGLTGSTLGTVGLGNVARELFALTRPFGTRNLAADPWRTPEQAAALGAELVELPELLRRSDVVVVTSALTPETHRLLDREMIALMPPHAVLVNVARGPIVDTEALTAALVEGRLAGAGLDVVDPEPLPPDHPLVGLDQVILSPHGLAWTDELARGNGSSAVRAILAVRDGRRPDHVVNPEAFEHPRYAGAFR